MQDERINLLAKNLVNYSCALKKGEKVLIEAKGVDYMLVSAVVREVYKVGALPFVEIFDNRVNFCSVRRKNSLSSAQNSTVRE